MDQEAIQPQLMIRPGRRIEGISAMLLPFLPDYRTDWNGFEGHLNLTCSAGLIPAVNMDTGYANLITDEVRREVLLRTSSILAGEPFVAGAFVADQPGAGFNRDRYARQIEDIQQTGGTPILFQSYGLTQANDEAIIAAYQSLAKECDRFLAFELGTMFAPFGKIYSLATYADLMAIPQCIGAKHSSLSRKLEWQRLQLRDRLRPDFKVYTGNDLAIDMVMYGSDYLLGLSTFAPEAFALRDRYWQEQNSSFYELNDLLQYLGFFAFRAPVPAYKHSAAQFLHLQGVIASNWTHPQSPNRPESDLTILADIAQRLQTMLQK